MLVSTITLSYSRIVADISFHLVDTRIYVCYGEIRLNSPHSISSFDHSHLQFKIILYFTFSFRYKKVLQPHCVTTSFRSSPSLPIFSSPFFFLLFK